MTNAPSQQPTVHLIFSVEGLNAAHERSAANDLWVLIGDGVYAAAQTTEQLTNRSGIKIMAADAAQRGVVLPKQAHGLDTIDDAALVVLIAQSGRTVSWQ